MREIKFRGYSRKLKSWLRGSLIYVNKKYYVLPNSNCKNVIKIVKDDGNLIVIAKESNRLVDPKSVGQYTGLKDKNGEEIYEGDIIKLIDEAYEVTYNNISASFIVKNDQGWELGGEGWKKVEVIGNIYENPELLEEY